MPCPIIHLALGALAQLVECHTGSVDVSGSSPLCSTNKDPTFVYHDKSGVLPYFRAKQAENKQNTGKSGSRSGQDDCAEAFFSFPAAENARKCWCTFVRSLLCKDLRVMTR